MPPRLLVRLLGRAGAKGVLCLLVARRSRPDWIVCYSLVPHGLNAWLVARLARVPRVLYHMIGGPREWEGGGWTSDNRLVGRLRRPVPALERALLAVIRSYTAVVTMGELGRRRLIENGIPAERVVAVPPSVDAETFHPRAGGERRYHLVTVGALIARKRTQDLVEAVARLRPGRPELRAAVVGTGPLEEHLRAEAARLGVPDAVDFLGRRDDVEDVYAASEIFVLTSRDEGLSVAQIEAMASGLPAVVSDVGEAADLLRDGRNGYLFAAGDVETLVARLALLLDEPDLRRRMGAAAAEDARAHAGRERVSSLYRDLFRRLGE